MAIEYKRLTQKELDLFIQMRIHQLREEGAKEEIDLAPALKDYYERHMADGTFVSWIAVDGESIIATSGMSFVEKPPYFGCPSGLRYLVQQGISVIPKSTQPDRIFANADVFDFELSEADMALIDTMDEQLHSASIPDDLL